MQETLTFEEGKTCPIKIRGAGGGLSFSPGGGMLLVAAIPNPSDRQVAAWQGKWRAKLIQESEFPCIPMFAIGDDEDWILEAPCNPAQQEKESPGFCEALFARDDYEMLAVLVDSETGIIRKIKPVILDDMFIERLVLSWNPYRHGGDDYTKGFTDQEFAQRVARIFGHKPSSELWRTSW
ncbi:MAG: hypothetical protein ACE5G9_06640 [Nitrospinales bacterium]